MHSYMAHNGMLATVFFRLQRERRDLDIYLRSFPGGKQQAIEDATKRHAQLEAEPSSNSGSPRSATPNAGTPPTGGPRTFTPTHSAGLTSYEDPAEALQKRLNNVAGAQANASAGASSAVNGNGHGDVLSPAAEIRQRARRKAKNKATEALPAPEVGLPQGTSLEPSATTTPHAPRQPNILSWHPDSKIAVLARNIDAMEDELKSNGEKGLVWPQNVTFRHFFDFMMIPTLVYQLEYPRTKS